MNDGSAANRFYRARKDRHVANPCAHCSAPITFGEQITHAPSVPGRYMHSRCAPSVAEPIKALPWTSAEPAKSNDDAASVLARAVRDIAAGARGVDEDAVRAIVREMLDADDTGTRITITRPDATNVKVSGAHPKFATLVKLVGARKHAYLYGPAGSGKSHATRQCADALNLTFGSISLTPTAPASRIEGFINAAGQFADTEFYHAFVDGGLFFIDEGDNMSGALQVAFNGALANGHASFPCGTRERHADFVVVMAGNTINGASRHYGERRAFDGAFLSRFARVEWPVDTAHERRVALARNEHAAPWVTWVQTVRTWAAANMPTLLVTPRASYDGADLMTTFNASELADMYVLAGLDADARRKLLTANPLPELG